MGVLKTALLGTALAVPLMTGAAAAQDRTIDFWVAWQPGSEDEREAMNAIATFEAANPGVTVQTQVISYDALRDKLVTSIAGGDAPDITWGLIEWFGELNQMGALADLSDYAASSEAVAAFYPAVVEELSIAGELRALPNYLGLRALIYHQEMLEAAGVEVPTTWDELITTSQAIHEATGKYGFGIAGRGVRSPQELIMYLAQNGVEIATLQDDGMYRNTWADDPDQMQAAAEVFAFYRRMLDEGAIPPNAVGWGWEEEDNNFALGQYAMVVNGSWMENRIEQQPEEMADVATAAPAEGKEAATFFEIAPLYVFDNGRLDETLAFAEVLLSQEVQQALYPNRSARQDVEGDEVWGTPFTALTPIGVSFPPISLGSIPRDMEEALGRVLMAGDDPEAVAEWLSQAVNTSLRRSGQLSGS